MADFVVLKFLTEKSDLGWFSSIFHGRQLAGRQKSITLSKAIINPIWPNLPVRQDAYEASKAAMKAAMLPGGGGKAVWKQESDKADAIGRLPVHVDIYGPGGKPVIPADRVIKLQDKNWRLNGAFIDPDASDPTRFDVLMEGDVALIGFDGLDWPTAATVVLLAKATDAIMWADLSPLVTKSVKPMIQLDTSFLQAFADKHGLPNNHVIRGLYGGLPISPPIAQPSMAPMAGPPTVRKPAAVKPVSADEHKARLAANNLTGYLGEKAVDAYLKATHSAGGTAYLWMSAVSFEHPYDFEVLAASGAVDHVLDAKTTSMPWPSDFFMSSGELAWAAHSSVPYHIYRVSEMAEGKPSVLRISEDIRSFAMAAALAFIQAAKPGTKATGALVSPIASGIAWSEPITLPPTMT